jgi:hypothetical protein
VIGLGSQKAGLIRAHRLSWIIVNGAIPMGRFLCHRCDNPSCVRPDHMFVGTNHDNVKDMRAKGRHVNPPKMIGTSNVNAKLTPDDVRRMRALREAGATCHELAAIFGVYWGTAYKVCRGETWAHVR